MPNGADRQVYSPDHKFKYARTPEETPRGNQLISTSDSCESAR